MDDSAKELLKHLTGSIDASAARVTTQLSLRSEAVEKSMETLSNDFKVRHPRLEARVDDIQSAVVSLQQHAANKQPVGAMAVPIGGDPAAAHLVDALGLGAPPLVGKRPAALDLGQGLGEPQFHRGSASGTHAVPSPTPFMGMIDFQSPMNLRSPVSDSENLVSQLLAHVGQASPSLQFPVFDGENPHMWQTLAEQYFAMFSIHESYWVSMSILNFVGSPKSWLHSVRKKLANLDWSSFCTLIYTRFGRDRHQLLIRQFYTLKQTYTVGDYIEHFEHIMNNLLSYSDTIHPLYFLTRFVEGLRTSGQWLWCNDRQTWMLPVHWLCYRKKWLTLFRPAGSRYQENLSKGRFLALPAPPVAHNVLQNITNTVPDRKYPTVTGDHASKLQTLRDYRRARGLCFKCGEKWGRKHSFCGDPAYHFICSTPFVDIKLM